MAPGGSGSHNGGRELLPFVEKHLTKYSDSRNPTMKKYARDTEGPETLSPGEVTEEFERFEAQQCEAEVRERQDGAEARCEAIPGEHRGQHTQVNFRTC